MTEVNRTRGRFRRFAPQGTLPELTGDFGDLAPGFKPRFWELFAVFFLAMASLLFEVTVTKIFEYSVWANYAYMVVSTAMFGLGLSGVILTRWPSLLKAPPGRFLALNGAGCGVAMFAAFLVLNAVPIHLPDAPAGWGREALNVAAVFLALSLPFVSFGLVIGFLFDLRGERANVYYGADLVGAGLGSFLVVPLIGPLEPQGLVTVCTAGALAASALFLPSEARAGAARRRAAAVAAGLALAAVLAGVAAAPRAAAWIPLAVHVEKRSYKADLEAGRIEAHGWSALSRVDIARFKGRADLRRVWIAGGINESSIVASDGDFPGLPAGRPATLEASRVSLNHLALPHLSKSNHTVCVIGTSGGADSFFALRCGARHVTGVEMDPVIARFVTRDYRPFTGGLFTDGERSALVVDEGRSFLRRCTNRFDVIQMVNNFTPIAFQNGALNLSEAYLLTVESFGEFYDHLTDDGILAISRYNSGRLASIAVEMLRRRGVPPRDHAGRIVICQGPTPGLNTFLLRRNPFRESELNDLRDFYAPHSGTFRLLFDPGRPETNLYHRIVRAEDPRAFWRVGPFDFSPSTDNRPFFNHTKVLGAKFSYGVRQRMKDVLPLEIREIEKVNTGPDKRVPRGDMPPLIILLESFLFASVFFGVPMLSTPDLRANLRRHRRELGYFACLGIAFIVVEICLMQRMVLFLGAPVYSIAAVLCSLLVFAGIGSIVSGRLPATRKAIGLLLPAVAAVVLAMHFVTPLVMRAFLGASLPVRVAIALGVIGISGFVMGMPMPTGIRYLKASRAGIIPWAWAANGYFTVIGSALSVLLVVNAGFHAVYLMAAAVYAVAPVFLKDRSA